MYKELNSRQKKALELMICTNMTQKEIAEELNVAESTVSTWKTKANFIEAKKEAEKNYLSDLSLQAIKRLRQLLYSESDQVSLNACRDILDRTGYKPREEIDMNNQQVVIIDNL